MRYAIWHHLHNLLNLKNTHGGVLLLVNFTRTKKSCKASHINFHILQETPKKDKANDKHTFA